MDIWRHLGYLGENYQLSITHYPLISRLFAGIKHIFFDLDGTLWDLHQNSREVLTDLYQKFSLHRHGVKSLEDFVEVFTKINHEAWAQYRDGSLTRERLRVIRFERTLAALGVESDSLPAKLADIYLHIMPSKTHLHPGTHNVLRYLKEKYVLHILTNGFNEVQGRKLKNTGIDAFFKEVITAEDADAMKPNARIFEYAFAKTGTNNLNALMIGDEWPSDVAGAIFVKMDCIWINHENADLRPEGHGRVHEIHHLDELKNIL